MRISKLNQDLSWSFAFSLFLAAYSFSYWPITEGWFIVGGSEIRKGLDPYVDFYAYLPPSYYWFSTALTFSDHPILLGRIVGVFFNGLTFYFLLRTANIYSDNRFLNVSIVSTTLFLLTSSNAFINYDFLFLLYSLTSICSYLLLSRSIFTNRNIFLIAVVASSIASIKQSNGGIFFLTIFLLVAYLSFKQRKHQYLIHFFLGVVVCTAVVFLPVLLNGSFDHIIDSLFSNALQNKGGSISHLVLVWMKPFFTKLSLLDYVFDLLIFSVIVILTILINLVISVRSNFSYLISCGIFLVTIFFSRGLLYEKAFLLTVYFTFMTCGLMVMSKIIMHALDCPAASSHQSCKSNGWMLPWISLGLIIGAGTSGGFTYTSIALPLFFMTLFAIGLQKQNIYLITMIIGICFSSSIDFITQKFSRGWHWWGVEEPISLGFSYFSETNKARKLGLEIRDIAERCLDRPKNLMSYPHLTTLNLYSNLSPYGKAHVFWFDYFAEKDAQRVVEDLQIEQPDLVAIGRIPENALGTHKKLFKLSVLSPHDEIKSWVEGDFFKDSFDAIITRHVSGIDVELWAKEELGCQSGRFELEK